MFFIDKPYVSDFLIRTLKENNFEVVATDLAKELIHDESITWISEETAIKKLEKYPDVPVYTNSENSLTWMVRHIPGSKLTRQVQLLKDKAGFRELLRTVYPDFFFKTVTLQDIEHVNLNGLSYPFVFKPNVGFFSERVRVIENESAWESTKRDFHQAQQNNRYPVEVLNTSTFIIEEYIEGDEYAVDFYYDRAGEVVILNILHHRFSSGSDTSDRVYSTSKEIVLQHKDPFKNFLDEIGSKIGLRNFPGHAELRVNGLGQINPIEINPLRFGGLCTTGDLPGLAIGYNSYNLYYKGLKPDWDEIYRGKENKIFSLIVLNNNSGLEAGEITNFEYDLLAQDFENPLVIRQLDINEYPVFGFVFTETHIDNQAELDRILVSDLRKYITPK